MSTRRSERSRKPVIRRVHDQSSRITQNEEVERHIPKLLNGDKALYEAELKPVCKSNPMLLQSNASIFQA